MIYIAIYIIGVIIVANLLAYFDIESSGLEALGIAMLWPLISIALPIMFFIEWVLMPLLGAIGKLFILPATLLRKKK